jgi:hypothetical protein
MKQSRLMSPVESVANVIVGYGVAVVTQILIFPIFGLHTTLAQNLRADLKGTGLCVQLVNPGFVDTRLTRKNDFRMPFIMTPDKAAGTIARHMRSRRFSRSFPALFALALKLRAVLMLLRM